MKIVCGSCSAKYSISDDKVQGKVFKIRCKKCSNVIVVKGGTVDEEVPQTSTGEWFVVIDGEQVGPVTKDEIEGYFLSGRINSVTYTWRDGMPDWIHLSDIPDFSHLSPATASPEAATNVVDASHYRANLDEDEATISETAASLGLGGVVNPFTTGEDPNANFNQNAFGNDPFGAAASADPFAEPSDPYGSNDLFNATPAAEANDPYAANDPYGASDPYGSDSYATTGSNDPYASESYDDPFTSGNDGAGIDSMGSGGLFGAFDSTDDVPNQPQISSSMGNSDMVGVRNENSVLFSLSSLDQVKAVNPSSPNTMDTSNGVIGEGSGLIDIQALAAAHSSLSGGSGPDPGIMGAPVAGSSAQVDPFAHGTMAMPALMPMGSHKSNNTLYIIIGLVALLLLIALGVAGYVLTRPDPVPTIVTKEVTNPDSAGVTKEELMKLLAEAKKTGDSETTNDAEAKIAALALQKAEDKEKAEAKKETKPPKNETAREKRKRLKAEKKDKERKAKIAEERKQKRADAKAAKANKGGIDDLLSGIGGGKKKEEKKVEKKVEKKASGKQALTRTDVTGTIRKYGGRVANCAKTSNKKALKGKIKASFYVKPNGRVTGAKISGSLAGTDVARCVQKVVSGMKFPKTNATKNQKISYPFTIR